MSQWKEEKWVAVCRERRVGVTVEEGGVKWHRRGKRSRCHTG